MKETPSKAYSSHRFSVAPMLDYTDRDCRYFHRMITSKALLYTEMLVADAIIHGNRGRLLSFDLKEKPLAIQLAGYDAKKLAEAAKICEGFGYDEINLNVGCPSPRVQSGAFGACLMLEPNVVAKAVEAIKKQVSIPVTIKCRIGVDQQKVPKALNTLADMCLCAGADAFWVHARKAWLEGLSPKENRHIPPLDYGCVYEFKKRYPHIFVGLNGGITSLEACKEHLNHVDGVMVGREAYHKPTLLFDVDMQLYKLKRRISYQELMEHMYSYTEKRLAEGARLFHITRHMLGLFQGWRGGRQWRHTLSTKACRHDATVEVLREAFSTIMAMNSDRCVINCMNAIEMG